MSKKEKSKNMRMLLFFVGFVFLFCLIFSLGVIVGKGLINNKSNVITESNYDEIQVEEEGVEIADMDVSSKDTDESIDNVKIEDPVNKESEEDKTATVDDTVGASDKDGDVKKPEKSVDSADVDKEKPKKDVLETAGKSEKADTKTASLDQTFPETDPNGKYTIQIGSFKNKIAAEKLMASYKAKGYPVFIKEFEDKDKKTTWYRIRIGTFNSISKAKIYEEVLKSKEDKITTLVTLDN